MNHLLVSAASKSDVKELNFSEFRSCLLPYHVLKNGDTHIFIYALGGDTRRAERVNLMRQLKIFPSVSPDEIPRMPAGTMLSIGFILDADNHGIASRLDIARQEVAEAFEIDASSKFQANGSVEFILGIKIGCFVFSEPGSDCGKLENLLLPMMKISNEAIFSRADEFLTEHHEYSRCRKLKLVSRDGQLIEERRGGVDYDHSKSIIGIAGQLQRSGKSNAAYISDCDYLNLWKLQTHESCKEILSFVSHILTQSEGL